MNNKVISLFLPLLALSACTGYVVSHEEHYYVSYMLNFKVDEIEMPSGDIARGEDILYEQYEINIGEKLPKAATDPVRLNYEFGGWAFDKEGTELVDFENEVVNGNYILYAKWDVAGYEEYEEPEYVYPEDIDSSVSFEVTGILNIPNINNSVKLSTGAIKRLEANADDVKFAINYKRNESTQMTSATYDATNKVINVTTNQESSFNINVIDNSSALSMAGISSTYEQKASNYETKLATAENYHIMLAGSSSMEFWETSSQDLNPIVSYNTGIGGTTVEQWSSKLIERLVTPYSPKCVVYYVGVNNIINSNDDGNACGNKLLTLFDRTHELLPNTQVFYVLINKLPGYMNYADQFDIANNMAMDYMQGKDWISYIDAGACLMKESGKPNSAFFRTDGLHMSKYGYTLWGGQIKKALIDWLG